MAEFERRFLDVTELRAADEFGGHTLEGYAAIFGDMTDERMFGGSFRERIAPGAFKRALRSGRDVVALYNHDANHLLGRLSNKTLALREDDKGLHMTLKLPDTTLGRDLFRLVERGDLRQMSFSFGTVPGGESWERVGKMPVRTLTDVDLHDVSVVTTPAYPSTSVAAREFAAGLTSGANSGDVDGADIKRRLRLLELEG